MPHGSCHYEAALTTLMKRALQTSEARQNAHQMLDVEVCEVAMRQSGVLYTRPMVRMCGGLITTCIGVPAHPSTVAGLHHVAA